MKNFSLLLTALVATTTALPHQKAHVKRDDPESGVIPTGPGMDMMWTLMNTIANSPAANSFKEKVADSTTLKTHLRDDAIRVKTRYGPYTLPGANETLPGASEPGSINLNKLIPSLCDGACTILAGRLTLEYKDGKIANYSTGVYNHHIVIMDLSRVQQNLICPGDEVSGVGRVPTIVLGGDSDDTEQLFTSPDGQYKSGYHLKDGQAMLMSGMLVNYQTEKQDIYITMEKEYLKGEQPGYLGINPLSISVGGCANQGSFYPETTTPNQTLITLEGKEWTVPADGALLNAQGHMHDGGSGVILELNGKMVCNSSAEYGIVENAGGMGGMDMGGGMKKRRVATPTDVVRRDGPHGSHDGEDGVQTITHIGKCTEVVPVKEGDKVKVTANYDLVAHPMRVGNDGKPAMVMGLGVGMFAFPVGTLVLEGN
ncbi:hypothetical protein K402DRAFT_458795 [Aulographum hederae CBS 113979]|uniref:Uncharacterized protein n=1 Tax=Aulographum hederae CBS 113979 TaxID=1176131 RepID=A0A6G1HH82_9PEZI|nr:hypothetical protein K402DRAFT_458795 [Aulographum hederae CBS 113979]